MFAKKVQICPPKAPVKEIEPLPLPALRRIAIDPERLKVSQRIKIEGCEVLFPYKPYQIQVDYMQKVIQALDRGHNALLQSPTGTGKTLCLVCAMLGWLSRQREQAVGPRVKIVYVSRTHLQLSQVANQVKKTAYKPWLVTCSSRDQACIKPQFSKLSGNLLEVSCRKAITGGSSIEDQNPVSFCRFIKPNFQAIAPAQFAEVRNLDDMKKAGRSGKFCPFYFGRKNKDMADLVLLPYNYILDPRVASYHHFDLNNAIVVFDEAHNVCGVAEDGQTLRMSVDILQTADDQLEQLVKSLEKQVATKVKITRDPEDNQCHTTISQVKSFQMPVRFLKQKLTSLAGKLKSQQKTEGKPADVFDLLLEGTQGRQTSLTGIKQAFNGLTSFNIALYKEVGLRIVESMKLQPNWAIDSWIYFITSVFRLKQDYESNSDKTSVKCLINRYAYKISPADILTIELLCLDPSIAFQRVKKQLPKSIILTSGTLTPFQTWDKELGIDFQVKLANPHIVSDRQVFSRFVMQGRSGLKFNFSYQERNNLKQFENLALALIQICKVVPNGVLVIFSSYILLDKTRIQINKSKLILELDQTKQVIFQERNSAGMGAVLSLFQKQAKTSKGAILFAVCRGKVAEGLNFTDQLCRCVVLVGVPFPPPNDKKVQAKRKYLDKMRKEKSQGLSSSTWYFVQTIRAINQSAGRVIRHSNDFGSIIFFDQRFQGSNIREQLSEWYRVGCKKSKNDEQLAAELNQFFSVTQGNLEAKKQFMEQKGGDDDQSVDFILNRWNKKALPAKQQVPANNQHMVQEQPIVQAGPAQIVSQVEQRLRFAQIVAKAGQSRKEAALKKEKDKAKGKAKQANLFESFFKEQIKKEQRPIQNPFFSFQRKLEADLKKMMNPNETEDQSRGKPEGETCGICLQRKKLKGNSRCSHKFCLQCLMKWLQSKLQCPLCKTRMRVKHIETS